MNSNDIILQLEILSNNTLKAKFLFKTKRNEGEKYAFYLMRENKKIDERWYRKESEVIFEINKKAFYYIQGFIQDSNKKKIGSYKTSKIFFDYKKPEKEFLNSLQKRFSLIIKGDYKELQLFGFRARKQDSFIKVSIPAPYIQKNRNSEFHFQAWRFILPMWKYLFSTKNPFFLNHIMDYFNDFYQRQVGKLAWYDMAVGTRAIHIALALEINKEYSVLSIEKEYILYILAKLHLDELLDKSKLTEGNHAIWQMIGLKHLSIVLNHKKGQEYADKQLVQLFRKAFDNNYISIENSPFYHTYNMDLIGNINENLFPIIYKELKEIYNQAAKMVWWLSTPDKIHARLGDTEGKPKEYKYYNNSDCSFGNLLIKDLKDSGYQIVKSKDLEKNSFYFAVHKPISTIHMHCDYMSFILIQNNIEIFSDPGLFNYNHSEERRWFMSDTSHNVVGLSNEIFLPDDIDVKKITLDKLKKENQSLIFSGEGTIANKFEFKRIINLIPYKKLIIDDYVNVFCNEDIEIRFIFGLKIECSLHKSNLSDEILRLEYNNTLIATMYFQTQFKKITLLTKKDNKAWISDKFNVKESTNQLIITYPKNLYKIKTTVIFE